uniref:Uncharacterized protein n=1 Tax=Anguilla anguilla TaxID=7936 RepID=A0A0E9X3Z6_ANGAN
MGKNNHNILEKWKKHIGEKKSNIQTTICHPLSTTPSSVKLQLITADILATEISDTDVTDINIRVEFTLAWPAQNKTLKGIKRFPLTIITYNHKETDIISQSHVTIQELI